MTHWFKRQTSMRGRLSILLILLMVLPMVAVGWFGFQSLAAGNAEDVGNVHPDDIRNRAGLRISETVEGFEQGLQVALLDLSSRLVRLRGTDAASIRMAFGDLPPEQQPAVVAEMDTRGVIKPALGAEATAILKPFAQQTAPSRGYIALPGPGTDASSDAEQLYQVAIEPRTGGRAHIALRPMGGENGASLISGLPLGSTVSRALTLANAPVQAREMGSHPDVGRREADAFAVHDGVSPEFWQTAITMDGRHPVHQVRIDETFIGGIALRDPAGEPVGLALVAATDHDLFPPFGQQGDPIAKIGSIIGWIAVIGVLLAIGMGLVAPRWVWRDIRASTDFIFNSVDRLRELVRRNSRALDEQSAVIKNLMDSMNSLDTASCSIADTSRVLAHSAEQSAWVSQSGNQNAETAQRGVVEVRDRVASLSDQMEELERRCAAIGSILGFIDHLSNETNDLSINATIQAAGAGGSGRQFATVASEIGKLADQARKSTRDIQQLIEQIQVSSRTTLDATKEGHQVADRCLDSFEELESAFARILKWVEQTTESAHGIEHSTAQQAESLQVVSQSIESLEQRARETVGNYQAVVEAADELAELGAEMNVTWRVG
jgi:hypothetical protein